MPWTEDTWEAFCSIVEEAWPGEFDDAAAKAWRVLFDDVPPEAAIAGVKRLMLEGRRFRPSASEVLGKGRNDPSKPTFDEAYQLIFGAGGVLAAMRSSARQMPTGPGGYPDPRAGALLARDAAIERARSFHPLIGAFVVRQGIDRLRTLPIDDPEYGELRRKDLREAWEAHVEAFDGREVAALAAGASDRGELRALDPLAALPAFRPAAGELEAGPQ